MEITEAINALTELNKRLRGNGGLLEARDLINEILAWTDVDARLNECPDARPDNRDADCLFRTLVLDEEMSVERATEYYGHAMTILGGAELIAGGIMARFRSPFPSSAPK